MKRTAIKSIIFLLALCLTNIPLPWAGISTVSAAQENFTDSELDELLAPIALYPDPILAQMLPASTFIEQLDEASRVLGGRVNESQIANQDWDVSVKAVAHYPDVLQMLAQSKEWTTALGQAVVSQSTDVMKSIQRLRTQAKDAGNLTSNEQMTVVQESAGQPISIEPAQPEVIYVPQYNPQVVYEDYDDDDVSVGGAITASLLAFGTGWAIGAWLNRGMDWWGWRFPYHGWIGGGWIGRSRPFVNIHNNIYVNNRFRNLDLNRNILNRDISRYRGDLRRDADLRRDRIASGGRERPAQRRDLRDRNAINDSRVDALRSRDRDRDRLGAFSGRETRDIKRPQTRSRDIPRPQARAGEIRRPVMDTRDISRPSTGARTMPRPTSIPSQPAGPRLRERPRPEYRGRCESNDQVRSGFELGAGGR